MKTAYQLSPGQLSRSIQLNNMRAAWLHVANRTGSGIAVRVGGTDIPSLDGADEIVPALGYRTIPVDGTDFGVTFTDPTAITSTAQSNLFTTATIILGTIDEPPPAFGSGNFQSLSLSDLSGGLVAIGATPYASGTFDIGAWGGAIVSVFPSPTSGQGILRINVSDGTTTTVLGEWGFWPNIPIVLLIPRTVRYFNLDIDSAGIPGNAAVAGSYAVRATLEEIVEVAYTPSSASITDSYTAPNLSEDSFIFVTKGMQAVSIGINNSGGADGELVLEASQSPAGPWRLTSFREQDLSGTFYNSIYRSVGNLDYFMRVRILEIGNTGPLTGTLTMSVQATPDLTQSLQAIFAALGDIRQPTNANQSIFHILETSLARLASIWDSVGTASGQGSGTLNTIGQLRSILATLASILTATGPLGDSSPTDTIIGKLKLILEAHTVYNTTGGVPINTFSGVRDIGTVFDAASANTVIGRLKAIANSLGSLPGILTALTTFDTFGGSPANNFTQLDFIRTGFTTLYNTMISSLSTIATNTGTTAANTTDVTIASQRYALTGTGALALSGTVINGVDLIGIQISTATTGFYQVYTGTAGAPIRAIFSGWVAANLSTVIMLPYPNKIDLTANQNRLWYNGPAAAAFEVVTYPR